MNTCTCCKSAVPRAEAILCLRVFGRVLCWRCRETAGKASFRRTLRRRRRAVRTRKEEPAAAVSNG